DDRHSACSSHDGHRHAAQGQSRSGELDRTRQRLRAARSCRRTASRFLRSSVVAEEITKDSKYKGTRVLMDARMDNVRLRIQIDFGVGDVMVPGPRMIEYPAFLASDTIQLLAYPIESAVASIQTLQQPHATKRRAAPCGTARPFDQKSCQLRGRQSSRPRPPGTNRYWSGTATASFPCRSRRPSPTPPPQGRSC
ncbi:MAG: nucleotidyl transferase AbiEii/AbiGii toxin family protein, partial [Gammaproteobacteria bacterium]|nr:nucleotidyl transferase AbiEii/AbiGii toxin family protein [Gammaproteobacteria bacterium]